MLSTFLDGFVIAVCVAIVATLLNPLHWTVKRRVWVGAICVVVAAGAAYFSHTFRDQSPGPSAVQSPYIDPNAPIEISGPYTSKTIRLPQGGYQDFKWKVSVIRVEFVGLVHEPIGNNTHYQPEAVDQATIHVSNGGIVYGGEQTSKITINEYSLPTQIPNEDEPRSIYSFQNYGSRVDLFRVVVDHINPTAKEVTLNVVFAETPR